MTREHPAILYPLLALATLMSLGNGCNPVAPEILTTQEACDRGLIETFQCDPCYTLAGGALLVCRE